MITYTFTVPAGQPEKKIEAMSLKKAMKSFQGGDAKEVEIKWTIHSHCRIWWNK